MTDVVVIAATIMVHSHIWQFKMIKYLLFSFFLSLNPYVPQRTTFSEFAQKHGRDQRFKGIDKMRERESLFNEFLLQVRKQAKQENVAKSEKVKQSVSNEVWVEVWVKGHFSNFLCALRQYDLCPDLDTL